MAKRFTQPLLAQQIQTSHSGLFRRGERPIAASHGGGKVEIARSVGADGQSAYPSCQQIAVSQSQGFPRLAISLQQCTWRLQASTLVRRRDRHHSHSCSQRFQRQGEPGWIQKMEMQAAELKATT